MGYTPPYLNVRHVIGGVMVFPPQNTSTTDLILVPNSESATLTSADTYIEINGRSAIDLNVPGGSSIRIYDAQVEVLRLDYTTPDMIIESIVSDKNLYLATNGTGKVKFGTHTGSGDVACNGSIAIIDAGGTPRKLMTTA